ncbi:aspartic peptidase domain-containing protein [Umbelopsis sp. AD052]|nr:aspartic peptidase domain-containing protein [Umbelopsis sp. AD052]
MLHRTILLTLGYLLVLEIGSSNASISLPIKGVKRMTLKSARVGATSDTEHTIESGVRNADLAYLLEIGVGSPPQPFTLLFDTGSSTTWIPVDNCGHRCGFPPHGYSDASSSTSESTPLKFDIQYGRGFAEGYFVKETVTLGNASIPQTYVAVSNFNDGELSMDGADGIFGAGPDELSYSDNSEGKIIPTVLTSMKTEKLIDERSFSVYFQPRKDENDEGINGVVTFGGVDKERIEPKINYANVTKQAGYKDYWAINIDGLAFDNQTVSKTQSMVALVDTGTTMVLIPEAIARDFFRNIPSAYRSQSGLFVIPCNAPNLPTFSVIINGEKYTLDGSQYVIPRFQVQHLNPDYCYTYIQSGPPNLQIILGYGFLQSVGTIYNMDTRQIGFGRHKAL